MTDEKKKAPDLRLREDKLTTYLEGEAKTYLFDEFSGDYTKREGMGFLSGVSIPLRPEDLTAFHGQGGLSITQLADNMAVIMGINPKLPYVNAYLKYLALFFNETLVDVLTDTGGANLAEKHYRKSAIYFRAALLIDASNKKAVFGYACCLREWYLSLEGDDEPALVSVLKSEAMEYFEWTVELFPDFSAGYYFLGYAYLNMALYTKAWFIFRTYVELESSGDDSGDAETVQEIKERMTELEEPKKIEGGINKLLTGHIEEGLSILEPYTNSQYSSWWPLHYYLACAYRELGYVDEAIEGFKNVMELCPSNEESAQALADLYASTGDAEMAEKYLKKSAIIRKNRE